MTRHGDPLMWGRWWIWGEWELPRDVWVIPVLYLGWFISGAWHAKRHAKKHPEKGT